VQLLSIIFIYLLSLYMIKIVDYLFSFYMDLHYSVCLCFRSSFRNFCIAL